MSQFWWLSTETMTVIVEVDGRDKIVRTPPVLRRFLGQDLDRLKSWLKKQPGYIESLIPDDWPKKKEAR